MNEKEARRYMELAIDVMKKSIAEPRTDGKASPKVGAVLVQSAERSSKPKVTTAFRGELREGDHAEYTLLERKNRDQRLDESVLFATLEPCAPNARKHPKLGCAERIVLARIKEVWIGIADEDPTVNRKGIKYLQDHGVTVNMFDRDLQDDIQKANKTFLDQALERAAAASEEPPQSVVLSPYEAAATNVRWDDFSIDALQQYRQRGKLPELLDSAEFRSRLLRQGLLESVDGQFVPTGFGMLLFGKEPRTSMPQVGLLATIHYPSGTEEVRNFDGPQVFVAAEAIQWLRDKLPNVVDRTEAVRSQKSDPLFELIRESIVNALVHRDYSITGAKTQLSVFPDRIEVRSPGGPVSPITLEQLQSFEAPMLSRNPVLHYVFAKLDLAEERGLGLKSMRSRAQENGLRLPQFSWDDPYLVLTLFPIGITPLTQLSESERNGWQWLISKRSSNTPAYSEARELTNVQGGGTFNTL